MLFMTFLVAYTLRAIIALFVDYYQEIVCQMEIRWVVNSVFRFFFMYTAILSMLVFHHSSFRHTRKVTLTGRESEALTCRDSEL